MRVFSLRSMCCPMTRQTQDKTSTGLYNGYDHYIYHCIIILCMYLVWVYYVGVQGTNEYVQIFVMFQNIGIRVLLKYDRKIHIDINEVIVIGTV